MSVIELIILSIGLGMDAFAVSICKGITKQKMNWNKAVIIGLWFGFFQSFMPALGYLLGNTFESIVVKIDHWIAFALLVAIGINMIKNCFEDESEDNNDDVSFKTMFILAIATSIDALSVGITFAFFNVNLLLAISLIGIITFTLSVLGTKVGNKFGDKFENKAKIFGGSILILLGTKILLEHLVII